MDEHGERPRADQRPERGGACARVGARVAAFVDGTLPPLEAARDAGHREACAACDAELNALYAARAAAIDALGPPTDLAWLHAGLEERLGAAVRPRRPRLERWLGPPGDRAGGPVLVAAAAILALMALSSTGLFDGLGELVGRGAPNLEPLEHWLPDLGGRSLRPGLDFER